MKNPDWTRDEHLLVLDLYLKNPKSPPSKESKEVLECSASAKSGPFELKSQQILSDKLFLTECPLLAVIGH